MFKVILTTFLLVMFTYGRELPTKQGATNQVIGSSVDELAKKDVEGNIASRTDVGNDQESINEIFGTGANEGNVVQTVGGNDGSIDRQNGQGDLKPREELIPKVAEEESTPAVGAPNNPHHGGHENHHHHFHHRRPPSYHRHHDWANRTRGNAARQRNDEWTETQNGQNDFESQAGQGNEGSREELIPKGGEGQSTPSNPQDCHHDHGRRTHHHHHHSGGPPTRHHEGSSDNDQEHRIQKRQDQINIAGNSLPTNELTDIQSNDNSPTFQRGTIDIDTKEELGPKTSEGTSPSINDNESRPHENHHRHRGHHSHNHGPCSTRGSNDQADKPTPAEGNDDDTSESQLQFDVRGAKVDNCDHHHRGHDHQRKGHDRHHGGRYHHHGKHDRHDENSEKHDTDKQTTTENALDLDGTKLSF